MPVVPPSPSPAKEQPNTVDRSVTLGPTALGQSAEARAVDPLTAEEMAALLAFLELLQEWDQGRKMV